MSKDKGVKNVKKAPADRSTGKLKVISSYKSENRTRLEKQNTSDVVIVKSDGKSGDKKKG